MNDDEEMVTRPATTPVRSDSAREPGAWGERAGDDEGVEEGLGSGMRGMGETPEMEEAGYGHGV